MDGSHLKSVSVIIPCRNEERYIAQCLDSVLANDFPHDQLEIFVVDGRSTDRTREIVAEYAVRHSIIRLLDNPKGLTPAAMNVGLVHAQGEIIVRLDAHTLYEPHYIRTCVDGLRAQNAGSVGGRIRAIPGRETLVAQAIALAISHPFGVGMSHFRVARQDVPFLSVDTVPFGCFRKSLVAEIGGYNESLPLWRGRCNEDLEFNRRIRAAGHRIVLCTGIRSAYFARGTVRAFVRHNFDNGYLSMTPLGDPCARYSIRHFVPIATLLLGSGLLALSWRSSIAAVLLVALAMLYVSGSIYCALKTALRLRRVVYLFLMPVVFGLLHASYSLGSLYGLMHAWWGRWYNRKWAPGETGGEAEPASFRREGRDAPW